eukprot:jgi/Chrzof1/8171/Cz03g00110.t1
MILTTDNRLHDMVRDWAVVCGSCTLKCNQSINHSVSQCMMGMRYLLDSKSHNGGSNDTYSVEANMHETYAAAIL